MNRRQFLTTALAASLASRLGTPSATRAAAGEIPRRPLGRTGEQVSAVGLGGFHLGNPPSADEAIRLVRTAIDAGITFLDNCWDYHDGESEVRMGRALAGGWRDRAFLMTKVDGRDRKTAARQIDESLARLRTDRVDLLQIHEMIRDDDAERIFAPGGAVEALEAARRAGKARFLGFTGHKSPRIHLATLRLAAERGLRFDAVQMPLNAVDAHFDSFERKVLPVLEREGIGVLGMKPLGSGLLLEGGLVRAEECLRYALTLPTSVVITGCESARDLDQAIRVARGFRPMPDEERLALLVRTEPVGKKGERELYKTGDRFDATARNPGWLGEAGDGAS